MKHAEPKPQASLARDLAARVSTARVSTINGGGSRKSVSQRISLSLDPHNAQEFRYQVQIRDLIESKIALEKKLEEAMAKVNTLTEKTDSCASCPV